MTAALTQPEWLDERHHSKSEPGVTFCTNWGWGTSHGMVAQQMKMLSQGWFKTKARLFICFVWGTDLTWIKGQPV